jgi:hypothetical protein
MVEAPKSKLQAPEKHQASSSKRGVRILLEFDVWDFSGAWMLELGAFSLP